MDREVRMEARVCYDYERNDNERKKKMPKNEKIK